MNNFQKRIVDHYSELSDSDKAILNKVTEHLDEACQCGINDLAKLAYTSPATLYRLLKKLGFKGFPDFKFQISSDLKSVTTTSPDSYLELKLAELKTTDALNHDTLPMVVNDILTSDRTYCYGFGWKQKQIIENFSADLLYHGIETVNLHSTEAMAISSAHMNEHCCLIATSYFGNQPKDIDMIRRCKTSGIKIISITHNAANTLSKLADRSLYFKDDYMLSPDKSWSTLSMSYLLNDLIHMIVLSKLNSPTTSVLASR